MSQLFRSPLPDVLSVDKVRLVEFIDAIPKSLSGKILRRVLRERV